ncbi:MAG: methionyl-tRNA formyltransferase [Candidatus Nanopelagicaceae bacterium]|nr:methionyl-tRNA formyltransferase [Candidatus Nanopelagicaceae bacterium]
MKIIIASSSPVAIPLILELEKAATHKLSALITNPDKATGRGQQIEPNELAAWCQEKNLKVFKPENPEELSQVVSDVEADLAITIAYGHLIPEEMLQKNRYGWLNVHFSLLPKWRGATPVQHSILNGEKSTGISIFKLDKGMDSGPIYLTQSVDISDSDSTESLLKQMSVIGAKLTLEAVALVERGVAPTAQELDGISFAPKLSKEDGRLNWNQNVSSILNRYRALSQNPGVWSNLGQMRIKIDAMRISYTSQEIKPGEILIHQEKMFVGAKNGVIEIERLTPAGRNQMSAAEYSRGLPLKNGLSFG